jgi:hypothetical protein
MNHPYKVKIDIYDGNNIRSPKQKELSSTNCYDKIKNIIKDIFAINSKYKFVEETQTINTHDDQKQIKYYIYYDHDKKTISIIFIQICISTFFTINELKHITELVYYNLQHFLECKLDEPVIYLPKP